MYSKSQDFHIKTHNWFVPIYNIHFFFEVYVCMYVYIYIYIKEEKGELFGATHAIGGDQ